MNSLKGFSRISAILISIALVFSYACDDSGNTGKFTVLLTDNPAQYQDVNVDIQQVSVQIWGWCSIRMA
ncbi:MAG: hypothetical protein ABEH43_04565 [Flavobacteriales bacterium]